MTTARPLCIAMLVLPLATTAALARPFPPFDEGPRDKGFAAFRAKLIKIAEARDLQALRRVLHPDIRMSFGGDQGIAAATKMMRDDTKRWGILLRVLRNGGKFDSRKVSCRSNPEISTCVSRGFIAPYTYWAPSLKGRDAFETMVITGRNVNVRAGPSGSAAVVGTITYRIVAIPKKPKPNVPNDWVEIETPGGKRGFVSRRYAVSPIDYRVGFISERGRWKMTFFLAGD